MKRVLPFLIGCFIVQQTCGNYLVAVDLKTDEIFACHTVTYECNKISYLELMVIRETNSCNAQKQIDPITGRRC